MGKAWELKDWKKLKGVTVKDHGVTPAIDKFLAAQAMAEKEPGQVTLRELHSSAKILGLAAQTAAKACQPNVIHKESKAMLLEIVKHAGEVEKTSRAAQVDLVWAVQALQTAVDDTVRYLEGFLKNPTNDYLRQHNDELRGSYIKTQKILVKSAKVVRPDDLKWINAAMGSVNNMIDRAQSTNCDADSVKLVALATKKLKAFGAPKGVFKAPPTKLTS